MSSVVQVPPRGRALLAGAALVLVVPVLVLLLLVEQEWPPLVALDEGVLHGLHGVVAGRRPLVLALLAVSVAGTALAYLVLLVVLVRVLLRRGRRRLAAFVTVALAGGQLLNVAAKAAVDRPRPALAEPVATATSSAFPSGHAQGVVVACAVLLLVLPSVPPARRRGVVAAAATWCALMGLSRLALGVHSLSDVLAGYLLGLAWTAACAAAFDVPVPCRPLRGGARARP